MPTELEELVEFLHHGNTQIRQIAAENLVPYSKTQQSLFKRNQLEPVKDLKLLVKDYAPIKQNALTMLINISGDAEALAFLASDDAFLETLLLRITNQKEMHANELAMLLANLSKHDSMARLFDQQRAIAPQLGGSAHAIDQLMDLFVRGAHGSWNQAADYDYLAYLFADLAKYDKARAYLTTPQRYDGVYPLAKLLPFTGVDMPLPRRLGVASTVKNVSFSIDKHGELVGEQLNLLSYVLVPLAAGTDRYTEEEQEGMLEDLQLLDTDVKRDPDPQVLKTHLETLLVLSTQNVGRAALRDSGTYYVIRELHAAVADEDVQETVDRLVQVLQRGEPEDAAAEMAGTGALKAADAADRRDDDAGTDDIGNDEEDQVVRVL